MKKHVRNHNGLLCIIHSPGTEYKMPSKGFQKAACFHSGTLFPIKNQNAYEKIEKLKYGIRIPLILVETK